MNRTSLKQYSGTIVCALATLGIVFALVKGPSLLLLVILVFSVFADYGVYNLERMQGPML